MTVIGSRTTYTIIKMMQYSWSNEKVSYLCRDGWGKYAIMQVYLKDPPERLGEDLFVLRNACLDSVFLKEHSGHESWLPIIEEVITVPLGITKGQAFIMRLDVEDPGRLIPLPTFYDSGEFFDMPTAIWMMRELIMFMMLSDRLDKHICTYDGGILLDPEAKRLVLYDFCWEDRSDPKEVIFNTIKARLCERLKEISQHIMLSRCDNYYFDDFKLKSEYSGDKFKNLFYNLKQVFSAAWLNGMLKVLNELAVDLKIDEQPFALQADPLMQRCK